MSKNLKKKSRIGLSAAAGLLATSGSIAPLTMSISCSENKTENSAIDKEYGVSKETYEDLKEQFRVAYGKKLEKNYGIDSKDYKIRMDALNKDLDTFDKITNSNNFGYTGITNALIDFAREHHQKYPTGNATETEPYGIQLVRHTRTKWSDLNDLYAGVADSFKTYMHNSKMPASTINRILAESKVRFDDLVKQLKSTYGNDALNGLLKAKEQMINFFDDVNDDIALISSTLRAKDFMSEFIFEYKTYDPNGNIYTDNCIDKLQKDYPNDFVEGNVLNDEIMNKIFIVTRKTTGQIVDFDAKTIVPGYTIRPKLVKIDEHDLTNKHTISIDFGIIKNIYAQKYANDPEKLNLVTGHLFDLNTDVYNSDDIEKSSTFANLLRTMQVRTIDYDVRLTPQEEANRLKATYFNHNSKAGFISFKWDRQHEAYEAFFDNARQNSDGIWTGTLNAQSLANAGLMISCDNKTFKPINNLITQKLDAKDLQTILSSRTLDIAFINNCSIFSDVVINENSSRGKLVTHDFKVAYANSFYSNNKSIAACNIDTSDYENECLNFQTSNSFYEKINNKFNEVAGVALVYDSSLKEINKTKNELTPKEESYLDELDTESTLMLVLRSITLAADGISLGVLVCFICKYMYKAWNGFSKQFIWNLVSLFLVCVVSGYQAYDYWVFETQYYKKVKDYINDCNAAKNDIAKSDLLNMLKQDLSSHFVLINKDGTYDKVLFAQQKAKFDKQHMSDMLNIYRKYATINLYQENDHNTEAQNAMHDFNQILKNYKITSSIFTDQFDKWKPFTGRLWWHTFGLSLIVMIINIRLCFVYNKKIAKIKKPENKTENAIIVQSGNDAINIDVKKDYSSDLLSDICSSILEYLQFSNRSGLMKSYAFSYNAPNLLIPDEKSLVEFGKQFVQGAKECYKDVIRRLQRRSENPWPKKDLPSFNQFKKDYFGHNLDEKFAINMDEDYRNWMEKLMDFVAKNF